MLIITMAWTSIIFTSALVPKKYLWTTTTAQGFSVALLSVMWVFHQEFTFSNPLFVIDKISGPLAILTCWLFPLTMLASISKMNIEPTNRQRIYIINSTLLQLSTLWAFTTSDLMLFFIFFETSLVPTMIIITRWGAQERRLEAGMYFAFYTMLGAIPLMMWLIKFYISHGSLAPHLLDITATYQTLMKSPGLFWIIFNAAFLVKLPMYGLHLWLPKAHVEAPIAGSMILAGTLLKLGGYGIMRTSTLLPEYFTSHTTPVMIIAALGVLATALLCLRQTDLKSLIAMSSVSHMNLVIMGVLIATPWAFSGALVTMIAHGLTSSALFCLANMTYERTNSRSMTLLRGTAMILPMMGAWWMFIALFNMALPPSINFMGEMLIFFSLFNWSSLTFLLIALNLVLTAAYTLYILWSTQRGPLPSHLKTLFPPFLREHTLLTLHIIPGLLLIFLPELLMP